MLRITTDNADDELVMKLEGCLAGPWVPELDVCWREAAASHGGRPVRLDMTAVCHVDAAGEALMTVMYRAGVRFVTKGCVMPEIVREISRRAAPGWSAGAASADREQVERS